MRHAKKDRSSGEHMEVSPSIEIDCVALVDRILDDCLNAKIPPYPAVIADVLAKVLSGTPEEHAKCFAELLIVIRHRVELFQVSMEGPPS